LGIQKEAQDQGIVRIWGSTVLNPYEGGRALEAGEAIGTVEDTEVSEI
jgi:hypothetical protein